MGSRDTESTVKDLKKEIEDLKTEMKVYRDERLVAVNKITSCFADLEEEYHEYPDPISQIVNFCDQLYRERQRWNLEVQRCSEEKGEEIWRQKQNLAEKDRELGNIKALLLEKDREIAEVKKLLLETDNKAKTEKTNLEETHRRQLKCLEEELREHHGLYLTARDCEDAQATVSRDIPNSFGDFGPETDDELKGKYCEVNRLIKDLSETFPFGLVSRYSYERHDAKFLFRQGVRGLPFLLHSIIWGIVVDGFFSEPYGFGTLGSGTGPKTLVRLYREWLRLHGKGDTSSKSRSMNARPFPDLLTKNYLSHRFTTLYPTRLRDLQAGQKCEYMAFSNIPSNPYDNRCTHWRVELRKR